MSVLETIGDTTVASGNSDGKAVRRVGLYTEHVLEKLFSETCDARALPLVGCRGESVWEGDAGREWQWLGCCLLEPQDMVYPRPDSSDGCASGTDQEFKGEHLLAAAQNSILRNGDAFSSTELVGIPAGATSWSLAGRVDGCSISPLRARVLAEVLR